MEPKTREKRRKVDLKWLFGQDRKKRASFDQSELHSGVEQYCSL
jgi:hypothetical protein